MLSGFFDTSVVEKTYSGSALDEGLFFCGRFAREAAKRQGREAPRAS
jgi:hypothetical protein